MPQTRQNEGLVDQVFQKDLNLISKSWNLTEFQRDKSDESIRFVDVPGAQWEDGYKRQFANRPRMELDMTGRAVHIYNGEWKSNRFGVKFLPDDMATSEKDADILNGLFRRDWRRDNGTQSIDNCVNEQSKGGVGAIRLGTRYLIPDDPDDKRQVITFKAIHNAYNTVIWDANAKEQDKSDAKWCAVLCAYTQEAFEEEFPGIEPSSAFQPYDRSIFNLNNSKQIYVAEHYKVTHKKGKAFKFINKLTGEKRTLFEDEIKGLATELADLGFKKTSERRISRRIVTKSLMYGGGYIEEPRRIAGSRIPVAPCYGYRSYVDGQEYWYGLVEKKKDAQRLVNMAISKNAENSATSSKSMPILTDAEVAGKEDRWSKQHLGEYNFAVINSVDEDGDPIQPRQIQYTQPTQIDPNTQALLKDAAEYIQGVSAKDNQEVTNPLASGKAITAAKAIDDMVTYPLLDNVAQTLLTVGKIYRSMADEIYAEQRFEKLVAEDGSDKTVLLRQYVLDRKRNKFVVINDITDKTFEVVVDTGPAFANRRQETLATIKDILINTPDNSPYRDLLFAALIENVDGPGLDGVKKFNRRQKILLGLQEPETEEEILMVQQMNQPKPPSATDRLIEAEAQRAEGEAIKNRTDSLENVASAQLKAAQAEETQAKTREILAKAGAIQQDTARKNAESFVKVAPSIAALNNRVRELSAAV